MDEWIKKAKELLAQRSSIPALSPAEHWLNGLEYWIEKYEQEPHT